MTTAHRPTFDPARGKEAQRGPAYHQRLLPSHTHLKIRQPGQGQIADIKKRDLRVQLLQAEEAHFSKGKDGSQTADDGLQPTLDRKYAHGVLASEADCVPNDIEAKRRKILQDTREIDADSSGDDDTSSGDESDEEDETAVLMRELEKIKKERSEQREREELEKVAEEQKERERDIAVGNPLLDPTRNFNVKRRWDDDVVFKNQARGTEGKKKKQFVNDLLRSDFHKKFMSKYVR